MILMRIVGNRNAFVQSAQVAKQTSWKVYNKWAGKREDSEPSRKKKSVAKWESRPIGEQNEDVHLLYGQVAKWQSTHAENWERSCQVGKQGKGQTAWRLR